VTEPERSGFYARTIRRLLDAGIADTSMSVLVVAGGELDRNVLRAAGFEHVTVTNLADGDVVADAEDLPFEDESFDLAVVSAGLHHCRSPHRALLELYRVARRAAVGLEARDSLLLRLATRAGAVEEYELTAVAANELRAGGVRDTAVPNYVYRWTEREVEKTIASHAPHARHRILFFHELEVPFSVVELSGGPLRRAAVRVALPALRLLTRVAPSQANLFGFAVLKPGELQPWLRQGPGGPEPDRDAFSRRVPGTPPRDRPQTPPT
jgi:SAM-dependent methyltransferase